MRLGLRAPAWQNHQVSLLLHSTHGELLQRHSSWVSEDTRRVPCLGFQSWALPLHHSSCTLPASVCLHRKDVSSPQVCAAGCVSVCSSSPSSLVPGLCLSSSSRLKAAARVAWHGCLSCEVRGAGLNQLFKPQTLDTLMHPLQATGRMQLNTLLIATALSFLPAQ